MNTNIHNAADLICVGATGLVWTAYGIGHKPLDGYRQIFAYTRKDAQNRFRKEYGNDSSILYLVGDMATDRGVI